MAETAQNVGYTNEDRDRNARETTVANADLEFSRLVHAYRDSPSYRLDRDRAELDRMSSDINFQAALAADNQGAKAQLTSVRARIASTEQELAKLTALEPHRPGIQRRSRA